MATKPILFEYYDKGEVSVKDKDPKADFKDLPNDVIVVKVKRGSKIKNIMGFVGKSLKVLIKFNFYLKLLYTLQDILLYNNLF
ncbi:ribonuclease P protein subunit p25-like protein [Nephila pilipes]|uniref:Ribonuclease P protein subunit p25-like protein n=1 Tax=Nephila pilipes TaxID=299642 RepID=A0A8X6T578_NEPPI|nr:ribonuclease P protein subunit p25-like protein [Nephila pilipes]